MKMSKEEKEEYRKFLKNTSVDVCKECEGIGVLDEARKEYHDAGYEATGLLHDRLIQLLEKQNEKLKCCGNCEYYIPCTYNNDSCKLYAVTVGDNLCSDWKILKEV